MLKIPNFSVKTYGIESQVYDISIYKSGEETNARVLLFIEFKKGIFVIFFMKLEGNILDAYC